MCTQQPRHQWSTDLRLTPVLCIRGGTFACISLYVRNVCNPVLHVEQSFADHMQRTVSLKLSICRLHPVASWNAQIIKAAVDLRQRNSCTSTAADRCSAPAAMSRRALSFSGSHEAPIGSRDAVFDMVSHAGQQLIADPYNKECMQPRCHQPPGTKERRYLERAKASQMVTRSKQHSHFNSFNWVDKGSL